MSLRKVVVLGSGKVGRLVISMLASTGEYAVTAADMSLAVAQKAIHNSKGKLPNTTAVEANVTVEADLRRVVAGHDYVVSTAPYHANRLIAKVAKDLGVNYLDPTEDVATTKYIKELSQDSHLAFIPQCGLAPGFISIVAAHTASQFQEVESVKMRVGALPMFPHNRLKYNLTWSTEGLINEYCHPCEAVVDGKLSLLPPLEGLEVFSLDGMEYEAFNTSGGLGTLAETWAGKVKNLDYKSIRYPGHREIVALLINDLKLKDDRETAKKLFENALPHTSQDVILIFVTATGKIDGLYSQRSYIKKVYNGTIDGEHWGGIQITTAAGICALLDLHAFGHLPKSGFIRQEDVPFELFIRNRFGKYYA